MFDTKKFPNSKFVFLISIFLVFFAINYQKISGSLFLNIGNSKLLKFVSQDSRQQTEQSMNTEQLLLSALARNPDNNVFRSLGYFYYFSGDDAVSEKYFQMSASSEEINGWATSYKSIGKRDLAKFLYSSANSAQSYINLGNMYAEDLDYGEAINSYFHAAEISTNLHIKYLALGHAYRLQNDWDLAISNYTEAINIEPNDVESLLKLGWVYLRGKSDFEKSKNAFYEVLRIQPNNFWAYLHLGEVFLEEREYQQAEYWFRRGLSERPNSIEAWSFLFRVILDTENCDDARDMLLNANKVGISFDQDLQQKFQSLCGE